MGTLPPVSLAKAEEGGVRFATKLGAKNLADLRKIPAEGGAETEVGDGWSWETHNAAQEDPTGRRLVYTLQQQNREVLQLYQDLQARQAELTHLQTSPQPAAA